MRFAALARRNFLELWRDLLSLSLNVALPLALLVVFQVFAQFDDFFRPAALTPGIVLFGLVMLMFSTAMTLARDRETALFSRLLTAPLRSNDFVAAYSLPYLPAAIIQAAAIFGVGTLLGLEIKGNAGLVALVLLTTAVLYIGLGMLAGAVFSHKTVPFAYTAVLLLTIFGGAWMDLDAVGGVLRAVGDLLPFARALDAARDVIVDGAGFAAIAADFYWVVGYTVLVGALAVFVFRRRMRD